MELHDLPLQFEGLFGEELEVTDVVLWVLICVMVTQLSCGERERERCDPLLALLN